MNDLRAHHFYGNRSNLRPINGLSDMPLLVTRLVDTFRDIDDAKQKHRESAARGEDQPKDRR